MRMRGEQIFLADGVPSTHALSRKASMLRKRGTRLRAMLFFEAWKQLAVVGAVDRLDSS